MEAQGRPSLFQPRARSLKRSAVNPRWQSLGLLSSLLGGRPFDVLKFRTMADEQGPDGELLSDAERLTRVGRLLRSSSMEELPELWNVVRGDMSLVGPRPLPVRYWARFTPSETRRLEVRPGLTGWAQVNDRNAVDWDERLAMDVWYVNHRSLWLDLRNLMRTGAVVVSRQGITGEDSASLHELCPPRGTSEPR